MDRRRWLLAIGGGLATTLLMLVLGSAWRPPVADAPPDASGTHSAAEVPTQEDEDLTESPDAVVLDP